MNMKPTITITILVLFHLTLYSQMSVNDPQNWCCDQSASIENVDYEIKTSGLYSEVSISFDVYTNSPQSFTSETQLEFDYTFNLNQKAVFNDSWLYIDDYISIGEIYEKSEGTAIYEEIVDRRQDPSILTKIDQDLYNLKIYPLFPDSTRRVKLSYLIPLSYDENKMNTSLPMQFLDDSKEYPQNITLTIHDDQNWFHSNLSNTNWDVTVDNTTATTYKYKHNYSASTSIKYQSDNPNTNIYYGTYTEEEDQYFQILYLPEIDVINTPRKHLILLDYDENHTNLTEDNILQKLKEGIKELESTDLFNIAYSDFITKYTFSDWQLATNTNIDNAMNSIKQNGISSYSRLTSMLPNCLEKIQNHETSVHLDILSSNVELDEENFAGPYLEDLKEYLEELENPITISVFDFATSKPWSQFGGSWRRGNDYFYSSIVELTSGNYTNTYEGDNLTEGLKTNFANDKITSTQYDFDINITEGFTYGTFFNNLENGTLTFNEPIIAIGKYYGEGEFSIKLNGIVNDNFFSENINLLDSEELQLDNKVKSAWNAQYILENEFNNDTDSRNEIISTSIAERLLSYRTIFLCLEPDTIAISSNNGEDDISVSTEDEEINNIDVNIYPNPFAQKISIEIPSDQITSNSDIYIEIYNMEGRLVYTYNEKVLNQNDKYIIFWEPNESISAGQYQIRIFGEGFNYTTSLIYSR